MLKLQGGDQFGRLAAALRTAGREVEPEVGSTLRAAGPRVGSAVLDEASGQMPRRGGLADQVRRHLVNTTGTRDGAQVALTGPYNLRLLDEGRLLHPVFARRGRPRTWVEQRVRSRAFSDALARQSNTVREPAARTVQGVLSDVARKV